MFLSIDTTSNEYLAVGLGMKKIKEIVVVNESYKQSELLLSTISSFLKKEKTSLSKIKGIIVASGPGGFSAVRIGVATANAFAYVNNVPAVSIILKKSWEKLLPEKKMIKIFNEGVRALKNKKSFKLNEMAKPYYDKEPSIRLKTNSKF
jgi:tRNA A37 threonylcarbamoyladenosine modification protein TsaB